MINIPHYLYNPPASSTNSSSGPSKQYHQSPPVNLSQQDLHGPPLNVTSFPAPEGNYTLRQDFNVDPAFNVGLQQQERDAIKEIKIGISVVTVKVAGSGTEVDDLFISSETDKSKSNEGSNIDTNAGVGLSDLMYASDSSLPSTTSTEEVPSSNTSALSSRASSSASLSNSLNNPSRLRKSFTQIQSKTFSASFNGQSESQQTSVTFASSSVVSQTTNQSMLTTTSNTIVTSTTSSISNTTATSSTSLLSSIFSSSSQKHIRQNRPKARTQKPKVKSLLNKSTSQFISKLVTLDHLSHSLNSNSSVSNRTVTYVLDKEQSSSNSSTNPPVLRRKGSKDIERKGKSSVDLGDHSGPTSTVDSTVGDAGGVGVEQRRKGKEYSWLFMNLGKSFVWLDYTGEIKIPYSRLYFQKSIPTCHDINLLTRSSHHLDICMGFKTGDVIWFDPVNAKYIRMNKIGTIHPYAVTHIAWLPGSESLFLASFMDGTLIMFDKDRDDHEVVNSKESKDGKEYKEKEKNEPKEVSEGDRKVIDATNDQSHMKQTNENDNGNLNAYVNGSSDLGWDFDEKSDAIFNVYRPLKSHKYNPLSIWKVSKKPITKFAFSPDCQHVAIAGLDGILRVIDYTNERLVDVWKSYFGGILALGWSGDGKYILTGSQDDLVTIYSFRERRIVARCRGHTSFVTGVSFDPYKCDEKNYRFGSVGEDGKLILWEFSAKALGKPKSTASLRRSSLVSTNSYTFPPREPSQTVNRSESISTVKNQNQLNIHPLAGKNEVPYLEPVMIQPIEMDPLSSIVFTSEGIVTSCRNGRVKIWCRPS
ncbi:WD40-repeat-containing domain protein [Paraphysoderma sedebokerense]|nr:WD40-repeat-containing domain protein [Paraphysoderma sedebokerense]